MTLTLTKNTKAPSSYNGLRKAMLQAMHPSFVMQRGDKA